MLEDQRRILMHIYHSQPQMWAYSKMRMITTDFSTGAKMIDYDDSSFQVHAKAV